MKKVFYVLVALTFIAALAYFFSTSNLKGAFMFRKEAILTINKGESGGTVVDWMSTKDYTLGKWKVSATQDVTISEFHADFQNSDIAMSANVDEHFNNVHLKVLNSSVGDSDYTNFNEEDFTIKLLAGETYYFEIAGQPDITMQDDFTTTFNGQEMVMGIGKMTLNNGTTYEQHVDYDQSKYFNGDENTDSGTFILYYAHGGYVVASMPVEEKKVKVIASEAALTVTGVGSGKTLVDWENLTEESGEKKEYTLGQWDVAVAKDMIIYDWRFFIGEPDEITIENFFSELKIIAENGDKSIVHEYAYGTSPNIFHEGKWRFTLMGSPKVDAPDFTEVLEGSKIAMQIGSLEFIMPEIEELPEATAEVDSTMPAPDATGIPSTDPSAPTESTELPITLEGRHNIIDDDSSSYFAFDGGLFSFGGKTIWSSDYVPDASEALATRSIVISVREKITGTNITDIIKPDEIHVYGPADSGIEVTDVMVGKSTDGQSYHLKIPTVSLTDTYNVSIEASGFVAKGYGPFSTAENGHIAKGEGNTGIKILDLEYAYYVTVEDASATKIENALVILRDGKLACNQLDKKIPGVYGCRIPFETTDLSFEVISEGYDTINSAFTVVRATPNASGEHVKIVMYPTGTTPADTVTETTTETTTEVTTDSSTAIDITVDASMTFDESPNTSAATGVFTPDSATEDTTSAEPIVVASEERLEIMTDEEYECEDPFTDTSRIAAHDLICRLYNSGIFSGKSYSIFAPYDYITRAEFLKVALLNSGYTTDDATGLKEYLSDVKDSDWFSDYVKIAVDEKFISTSSGKFNPNEKITRADAIVLTMNIARQEAPEYTRYDIPFSDVEITDYFADAVMMGYLTETEEGDAIIGGYSDGTYKPGDYIRRYESASIIYRTYLALYE